MYHDRFSGDWIMKYDLRPAEQFGELVDLFPPHASFWDIEAIDTHLHNLMGDFDADKDHILLAGDPLLIAATGLYAAGGFDVTTLSFLKWDKKGQNYQAFRIHI
jgi:hypothetical protein